MEQEYIKAYLECDNVQEKGMIKAQTHNTQINQD